MKKQRFKKEMCKMLAMATLATAIPFNTVGVMAADNEIKTIMSINDDLILNYSLESPIAVSAIGLLFLSISR